MPKERTVPLFGAAALMASILTGYWIIGPVWQIHDDSYYSMLAAGHGMLRQPVDVIPYMHPIVGKFLTILRQADIADPYATLLTMLISVAACVVGYRLLTFWSSASTWGIVLLAVTIFSLSLQYTAVAGFLVAAAVVNVHRSNDSAGSLVAWSVSGTLVLFALFLRVEMVLSAAFCLVPVLLARSATREKQFSLAVKRMGITISLVLSVFLLVSHIKTPGRLAEFYRLNDPMAAVMNYGYIEALIDTQPRPPVSYTQNDIDLLRNWFFGVLDLVEPSRMKQVVEVIPLRDIAKVRYRIFVDHIVELPRSHFLWLLSAALVLALFPRPDGATLVGFACFFVFYISCSAILKPPPERVAGGIALGLLLLALMRADNCLGKTVRHQTLSAALALCLLFPIVHLTIADRELLAARSGHWSRELNAYLSGDHAYAFAGVIPLRAVHRPFESRVDFPNIRFLGSLYLMPEVQDAEIATGCGGFIRCLASGKRMILVGLPDNVELIAALMAERYGKSLVLDARTETPNFEIFVLRAAPVRPDRTNR